MKRPGSGVGRGKFDRSTDSADPAPGKQSICSSPPIFFDAEVEGIDLAGVDLDRLDAARPSTAAAVEPASLPPATAMSVQRIENPDIRAAFLRQRRQMELQLFG